MYFAMKRDDVNAFLNLVRSAKSANLYVDVETARRMFHILEHQQYSLTRTNWRLHRLIKDAVKEGYEVLWVHVYDEDSGGWRKYPLILDEEWYSLAS